MISPTATKPAWRRRATRSPAGDRRSGVVWAMTPTDDHRRQERLVAEEREQQADGDVEQRHATDHRRK